MISNVCFVFVLAYCSQRKRNKHLQDAVIKLSRKFDVDKVYCVHNNNNRSRAGPSMPSPKAGSE